MTVLGNPGFHVDGEHIDANGPACDPDEVIGAGGIGRQLARYRLHGDQVLGRENHAEAGSAERDQRGHGPERGEDPGAGEQPAGIGEDQKTRSDGDVGRNLAHDSPGNGKGNQHEDAAGQQDQPGPQGGKALDGLYQYGNDVEGAEDAGPEHERDDRGGHVLRVREQLGLQDRIGRGQFPHDEGDHRARRAEQQEKDQVGRPAVALSRTDSGEEQHDRRDHEREVHGVERGLDGVVVAAGDKA